VQQQGRIAAMRSRVQSVMYTKENASLMKEISVGIEREIHSHMDVMQLAHVIDTYEAKLTRAEEMSHQMNTCLDDQQDKVAPPSDVQELIDENKDMQEMDEALVIEQMPTSSRRLNVTPVLVPQKAQNGGGGNGGGGGETVLDMLTEANAEVDMQRRLERLA
jgi:hypothetical protein